MAKASISTTFIILINNGVQRLPKEVYANDLHRLRMHANRILQGSGSSPKRQNSQELKVVKIEVAGYLNVVRKLIEGAS